MSLVCVAPTAQTRSSPGEASTQLAATAACVSQRGHAPKVCIISGAVPQIQRRMLTSAHACTRAVYVSSDIYAVLLCCKCNVVYQDVLSFSI